MPLQQLHNNLQGKLVKLADKLYNLRDMQRLLPAGWTAERVKQYHHWAARVCHGCRGTNDVLERKLNDVLAKYDVNIDTPPAS